MKAAIKNALKLRRKRKRRKPSFKRQEGRLKKLKGKDNDSIWRRPKGRHSKLRQKEKARGRHRSPGYGSPKAARGRLRSGLKEVRISTSSQLKDINPKEDAAVIAGSVGKAKRTQIIEQAKKKGIKIINA
jgi:large subunit ribosomal protein L32e